MLKSFAEDKQNDVLGSIEREQRSAVENEHLSELRETISFIKGSYERKFQERKGCVQEAVIREKEIWVKEEKQRIDELLKVVICPMLLSVIWQ